MGQDAYCSLEPDLLCEQDWPFIADLHLSIVLGYCISFQLSCEEFGWFGAENRLHQRGLEGRVCVAVQPGSGFATWHGQRSAMWDDTKPQRKQVTVVRASALR